MVLDRVSTSVLICMRQYARLTGTRYGKRVAFERKKYRRIEVAEGGQPQEK